MKVLSKFSLAFAILAMTVVSCKKDDEPETPEIPNEEEVITTVIYRLTPVAGGDDITFSFIDLDGDGGMDPSLTMPPVMANTAYMASVEFFNETTDPADNITLEVEEEGAEHQIFFLTDMSELTTAYADVDENGLPIGLSSNLNTGDVQTGELTIVLRHEPNKSASGVSDGDITNAGGETDIEVTFNVDIQ